MIRGKPLHFGNAWPQWDRVRLYRRSTPKLSQEWTAQPSIHSSPFSQTSFFQTGTDSLSRSDVGRKPGQAGGASFRPAGHDGELLGGMVASLLTFRDRGIVVAVMSNISYADTFSLGLKIAEAFAAVSFAE